MVAGQGYPFANASASAFRFCPAGLANEMWHCGPLKRRSSVGNVANIRSLIVPMLGVCLDSAVGWI